MISGQLSREQTVVDPCGNGLEHMPGKPNKRLYSAIVRGFHIKYQNKDASIFTIIDPQSGNVNLMQ